MNKNEQGFLQGGLDPAVQAAIGGGQRRQSERLMPKQERARMKKSQERQEKRNGNRAVYDLDPELIREIKRLADEHGTTASQVAGIALRLFLVTNVDLTRYRVRLERNPRYEYELVWKESE
jgi:hypothetical protein